MTLSYTREHFHCRACGTNLPPPYLNLGEQPLANALLTEPTDEELTFPLAVTLCPRCGLSQPTTVVDPAILYKDYAFQSGASGAWTEHAERLAGHWQLRDPGFVVDIAANDGSQLKAFHERGWRCVGVEPASMASVVDVPFVRRFFDQSVANDIVAQHGHPSLIVAQNVVGHVDDVVGFLVACASLLDRNGAIAIEVPHIDELTASVAFDTIYHEHLSYWSGYPLSLCAEKAGLEVDDIERLTVHGGSRRYWLRHRTESRGSKRGGGFAIFQPVISEESYRRFTQRVDDRMRSLRDELDTIHAAGKRLWAFGASAKGTVMLNALKAHGNTVWPECILDDTPTKQGKYSPGVHLPICPVETLREAQPDVMFILSWNWTEAIRARCASMGYTGEYLVGAPHVERFS